MFASETSRRRLQDMSSRRFQDVFKTSSRRLQRNNFSSSKTSSGRFARCLQDVFKNSSRRLRKTSSRRLGRRKIVTLKTRWRRLQDMTKVSVSSYKSRCECSNSRATWRIWNKIHLIFLLGNVAGNIISHYFFLTWKFLEFFFRLVWGALGCCILTSFVHVVIEAIWWRPIIRHIICLWWNNYITCVVSKR